MTPGAPVRSREWVLGAAMLGVLLALLVTVTVDFRIGGYVLAVVLASVATCRLTLPVPLMGAAAVRSRSIDAVVYLMLAVAVAGLAKVVPGP